MLCAFDFDGTLADSRSVYYKATRFYSKQNNFSPPSQPEMDLVMGNPNPPIVFKGWGDINDFIKHLTEIYKITDDLICDQPSDMPLFEGIHDLLNELSQEYILSIVTSRSLKPVLAQLEHYNIRRFFQTIRSDHDIHLRGYRGKPHPDKLECVLREMMCPAEKSVMVGDTLMDMAMAKSAGVKAIGVSWGYHGESLLREHGADEIVANPSQLKNTILKEFVQVP
ncbi:MAG: HAD family hydrolase [Alphaproteobacteria bacterium]|nr:HAD family hydrolase [Alphaproteobacteria bacterium]